MKYASQGKRSLAWWLQAVKWFGKDGNKGIMRGGEVPTHQVKLAMEDLASRRYILKTGGGRGKRDLAYQLTETGGRYLNDHEEELEAPTERDHPVLPKADAEPAADPIYTWKWGEGNRANYFKDGRMVASFMVPAASMKVFIDEQAKTPPPKADHSTAAPGLGVNHTVPQSPGDRPLRSVPMEDPKPPRKIQKTALTTPLPRDPISPPLEPEIVRHSVSEEKAALNTPKDKGGSIKVSVKVKLEMIDLNLETQPATINSLLDGGYRLATMHLLEEIDTLAIALYKVEGGK